jgi:hypothetical protein
LRTGVAGAPQNAGYGDRFKKKVKDLILEAKANHNAVAEETSKKNDEADNIPIPVFYSSFWGHTFKNQTDQLFKGISKNRSQGLVFDNIGILARSPSMGANK